MPTLEVGSIDDFIAEMGESNAYFWGVDQPLQDMKQKPMIGLLMVMSTHRPTDGAIIRYVENLGTTYTADEKAVKKAVTGRNERVTAIQTILKGKNKGYATGLWSSE